MNLKQLKFVLSGYDVKRYHTWPMIKEQTVGDHSARVAVISIYLTSGSISAVVPSLLHDVAEKLTGDLPATAKWMFPKLEVAMDEAEQQVLLKEGLVYDYSPILKAADIVELIVHGWEELKMGNRYGEAIIRNGRKYLHTLDLPTIVRERAFELIKEIPYGSE